MKRTMEVSESNNPFGICDVTPVKSQEVRAVSSTSKRWIVSDTAQKSPPKWENHIPPWEPSNALSPPCDRSDWSGLKYPECGLTNMTNTCFFNSVLQALFHLPPFVRSVLTNTKHIGRGGQCGLKCVLCKLYLSFQDMCGHLGPYRPYKLIAVLRCRLPNLFTGRQEDALEFLNELLQLLDDDFLKDISPRPDYLTSLTTPKSRIFTGWMKTTCICSNPECKFISETYAAFEQIEIIPSRSATSVQDLIEKQYVSENEIPIKCRACEENVFCERRYSVHKYPAVLLVFVKRFRFDSKVKDLRSVHVTDSVQLPGGVDYDLSSLVVHKGITQDVGHYITATKTRDGALIVFDDSQVYKYSLLEHDVKIGSYIIMYIKRTHQPQKVTLQPSAPSPTKPIVPKPTNDLPQKPAINLPQKQNNVNSKDTNSPSLKPINIKKTKRTEPKTHSSQSSAMVSGTHNLNADSFKPKCTPIKIQRTIRVEPQTHSSQSSAMVSGTHNLNAGSFKPKCTPIKIQRTIRVEPKTHSSQSSHDYAVVSQTHDINADSFKPKCTPIKIQRMIRTEPKMHSSQSSHDYAVVSQTHDINADSFKPKCTPIKIQRMIRTEPKMHSSQSSHDYAVVSQTHNINAESVRPPNCNPIVMLRVTRSEPKAHSSQTSHEYTVGKDTLEPHAKEAGMSSPNATSPFLPQVSSSQASVVKQHHVRQLSFDYNPSRSSKQQDTLPQNKLNRVQDIILTENDVPGAKLPHARVEANNVKDLKRFLKCRGIPCSKLPKRVLVTRVKAYKSVFKNNDLVNPGIDGGIWYDRKEKAQTHDHHVQDVSQHSQYTQVVTSFPADGWDTFPSHNIPVTFNFGRIYDYLVESAPQYEPILGEEEMETETEEENELELSVHDTNVRHHWKRVTAGDEDEGGVQDPFDVERGFLNDRKELRQGFRFLKSKHARNIRDAVIGSVYYVQCDMRASMEMQVYNVKIAISIPSGNIKLCQCMCMAQTSQRCGHISGLLLHVWCHVRLNGYGAIPCTSRPCTWAEGALKRDPGPINTNRYESCKLDIERRAKFDSRPTAEQVTVANQTQINSLVSYLTGNPYKTLWQIHMPLVYEDYDISCLTHLDFQNIVCLCQKFVRNLQKCHKRLVPIESNHGQNVFEIIGTAGQGQNNSWLAARSIRITASIAHKVLHFTTDEAIRSFLRDHLWMIEKDNYYSTGRSRPQPKAIRHGHKYEKSGVSAYEEYRKAFDSTSFVHDKFGLLVREDFPELGCSPDAIAFSEYNEPRLVEVKCPLILKDHHPEDFDKILTSRQRYAFCLKRMPKEILY